MTNQELKDIILSNPNVKEFKVKNIHGGVDKYRFFISSNGDICYIGKGRRHYGYIFPYVSLISECVPIIKDEVKMVKRFMQNVVKYLTASGMWSSIKDEYTKILEQGDDYLTHVLSLEWSEQRRYLNDTLGIKSFTCDNIVLSAQKGIKQINYDKYERDYRRKFFRQQIKENGSIHFSWKNGYDNYVEFRKGDDGEYRGWYAEEYVGCGNGYYYLALDEQRAMFIEKD